MQAMNQLLTQLRAATWLSVTAAQVIRRKKERNIWFTQPMREDLGVYFSIIQEAYFITHNNLTSDREGCLLYTSFDPTAIASFSGDV